MWITTTLCNLFNKEPHKKYNSLNFEPIAPTNHTKREKFKILTHNIPDVKNILHWI